MQQSRYEVDGIVSVFRPGEVFLRPMFEIIDDLYACDDAGRMCPCKWDVCSGAYNEHPADELESETP